VIKGEHTALPAAASPVLQDSLNTTGQQGSGIADVQEPGKHKGIVGWEMNNMFQVRCWKPDIHQVV